MEDLVELPDLAVVAGGCFSPDLDIYPHSILADDQRSICRVQARITRTDAELVQLVRRWMVWDWLRVVVIAGGFLSSVRAISIPYNARK